MKGKESSEELETMGEAYRELLQKALRKARDTGTGLYHLISGMRGEMAVNKVSEPEWAELEGSVRRDLAHAAQYLQEGGSELKDWLGFDVSLIEKALWSAFSEAANQTQVELYKIHLQAEAAGYHTGEWVGLGTIVCDRCGELLQFHKPGRIPPCPRCKGTHFHRPPFSPTQT
ncbi:MAG: zinc ribbon-containing protein [Gammaproteobacteria bacterium]|nr:zinc ribbon-containing protein [Gammaproteobacteria bacterium]